MKHTKLSSLSKETQAAIKKELALLHKTKASNIKSWEWWSDLDADEKVSLFTKHFGRDEDSLWDLNDDELADAAKEIYEAEHEVDSTTEALTETRHDIKRRAKALEDALNALIIVRQHAELGNYTRAQMVNFLDQAEPTFARIKKAKGRN